MAWAVDWIRRLAARRGPHICIGSVLVGAQVVTALQTIVWRSIDPLELAVISVCDFEAGEANAHETPPLMGAEDFAYMPEARPGAFIF